MSHEKADGGAVVDLVAIRARLEKAQEHCSAYQEDWPVGNVRSVLADLEVALSLVTRLQGERDKARAALDHIRANAQEGQEGA